MTFPAARDMSVPGPKPSHSSISMAEPSRSEPRGVATTNAVAPEIRAEVAHYVAQMTAEMAGMCRAANLQLLAYFLEMARIEATSVLHQSQKD